jgi:hypothetical protein
VISGKGLSGSGFTRSQPYPNNGRETFACTIAGLGEGRFQGAHPLAVGLQTPAMEPACSGIQPSVGFLNMKSFRTLNITY